MNKHRTQNGSYMLGQFMVLFLGTALLNAHTWSSLVEGGEQLDRPKSQTTMELWHACVA